MTKKPDAFGTDWEFDCHITQKTRLDTQDTSNNSTGKHCNLNICPYCDSLDTDENNMDYADGCLERTFEKMQLSKPKFCKQKTGKHQYCDEDYSSNSLAENVFSYPKETKSFPIEETRACGDILSPSQPSNETLHVYYQDLDGDCLLHLAVIQEKLELVRYFISLAPDHTWVNLPNCLLQTPLHLAVLTRQQECVRSLMVSGARVDARDLHGNTPLHIACREGYVEIVNCLLRPVYYEETRENRYEIPYQKIPQNLETRNYDGYTCLHLAAQRNYLNVIDLLLSKGAKINTRDGKSGRTILHFAAETGNCNLIGYLLNQKKVQIDCVTYGGRTPVSLAAGRGYGDVVKLFLISGANCSDVFPEDSESSESDADLSDGDIEMSLDQI